MDFLSESIDGMDSGDSGLLQDIDGNSKIMLFVAS